ncbi:uncharacterized protein SCHCODRAFT_02723920 [Schizophyllum commune H4-8]|uniref:uncharacterized protein n=1 Tax=Schizophyllum commune (strain H4-8 / FGSC 9210) TaxID=578458 RepID=UPI002160FABE|nr:uncharacterized protein SCHCODRAFT_02723920 [Schizophyllum commune H4-8]KAI5896096.1 hypothetical protein SCHCODRAFT_02723920 [Schizophyllum commune H4-8]
MPALIRSEASTSPCNEFRSFRLSFEAKENARKYGKDSGLFIQWFCALVQPCAEWLLHPRNFKFSDNEVREVLVFSQEWLALLDFSKEFALRTEEQREVLYGYKCDIPAALGGYWGAFHAAWELCPERRVKDSPYNFSKLDIRALGYVRKWFNDAGLPLSDMCQMFEDLPSEVIQERYQYLFDTKGRKNEPDTRRYWSIFLAGLARCLVRESLNMSGHKPYERQERFRVFVPIARERLSWLECIKDPVTFGGAMALKEPATFHNGSPSDREAYIVRNMLAICSYVLTDLCMAESSAEQAICMFIETHRPKN